MSKTTKIMELLGRYECILHHSDANTPVWLYFKSVDIDAEGWPHSHKRLIGKYPNMNIVLADILDSMNNRTFWEGNWKA